MITNYFIAAASVGLVILLIFLFKKPIVARLKRLAIKLQLNSLREAIHKADHDKETTGRKNMVVYNTTVSAFEPVQKKLLKKIAKAGKNKNNAAKTPGRMWFQKNNKKKKTSVDTQRVKQLEEESLYVTK